MPKEKRYVGKFILSEFTHPRTKKSAKRLYIHLPLDILEDERFRLEGDDQLLIEIENDKIILEKI